MGNKIEICYDDKLSYVGQMKNQKFDGEGTLYYNNTGDLYKGNFKDGMKHGLGELQFYSGDKYIGEFFQDQQHGKGKYISNNGYIYNGNFSFGTLLGNGEIRDINNELIYEGEFLNSLPHGFGISYVNGSISYVGKWNQNYYHGHGLLIENNSYRYGVFQEGKLVEQLYKIPQKLQKYINKSIIFDSNINITNYVKPTETNNIYAAYVAPTAPPIYEKDLKQIGTINPILNIQTTPKMSNKINSNDLSIKSIFNPMNIR